MATHLIPQIVLWCALHVPLSTEHSYFLHAIEDMALRCANGGLNWILAKTSLLKWCLDIGTACSGKWWNHHVKTYVNVVLGDMV